MVPTPLVIACLCILLVNGNQCPEQEELRKYMESLALDVEIKELEGTWMVIEESEDNLEDVSASTFQYTLDGDGVTMKVKGTDYRKEGGKDEFNEVFTKKTEGVKGSLKWTGNYGDGDAYERNGYIYYHDENALAVFTCDPTLDDATDTIVLVNAAKIKDVQDKEDNEAKKSIKKAQAKLNEIKAKGDEWEKAHEGEFGLLDETIEVDLTLLKPEV